MHIKIFIAGSKDTIVEERKSIKQIANAYQSCSSLRKGVNLVVEAVSYEEFPTYIGDDSHQSAYNKYISEKANIVFFVFRKTIGKITSMEFDIACESYKKNKHPYIFVLSHKQEGITSLKTDSLYTKLTKLGKEGTYFQEYDDLNDFQIKIRQNLDDYIRIEINKRSLFFKKWKRIFISALILIFGFICTYSIKEYLYFKEIVTYQDCKRYLASDVLLRKCFSGYVEELLHKMILASDSINRKYNCNVVMEEMNLQKLHNLNNLLSNMIPVDLPNNTSKIYVGKYELSERDWSIFSNEKYVSSDIPKSSITFYECQEYIRYLNHITGLNFRLPTTGEWESIASSGSNFTYAGSNKCDEVAWYKNNSGNQKHGCFDETRYLGCNDYDLYNLSGNVAEFCIDSCVFNGYILHEIKGGGYMSDSLQLQICFTDWLAAGESSPAVGFRLILESF